MVEHLPSVHEVPGSTREDETAAWNFEGGVGMSEGVHSLLNILSSPQSHTPSQGVSSEGSHSFTGCEPWGVTLLPRVWAVRGSHSFPGCEQWGITLLPRVWAVRDHTPSQGVSSEGSHSFPGCEQWGGHTPSQGVSSVKAGKGESYDPKAL